MKHLQYCSAALVNRSQAAPGKLGLDRSREQIVEQLVYGGALGGFAHDRRALLKGRIKRVWNDESISIPLA